ncbi:MAG TPA: hypothetical protein PLB62_04060 [Candidatus Sumerlaeota bacterium]|nr:hypothetical protein [Candidatus Sumerlaeota bacterium]
MKTCLDCGKPAPLDYCPDHRAFVCRSCGSILDRLNWSEKPPFPCPYCGYQITRACLTPDLSPVT